MNVELFALAQTFQYNLRNTEDIRLCPARLAYDNYLTIIFCLTPSMAPISITEIPIRGPSIQPRSDAAALDAWPTSYLVRRSDPKNSSELLLCLAICHFVV